MAHQRAGAVPTDSVDRAEWQRRAGLVAAYREMRGHEDPADALGPAPKPGQGEQYAAYRAAWRTLGRPEIEREELEMTDGQLRMWVRAAQREEAWALRYVGNELAGTRQAAAAHRQTAELRAAEADAATDPTEQQRLRAAAAQARALAETLDEQAEKLQAIDDARAHFLADTARTLGYGRRCEAELSRRHIDDTEPEQIVTAEEWLTDHRAAVAEDDQHRAITETDLTDSTAAQDGGRTRPGLEGWELDSDACGRCRDPGAARASVGRATHTPESSTRENSSVGASMSSSLTS